MVNRRGFLKLTGLIAAASAFEALPVAAEPKPLGGATESVRALDAAPRAAATRLAVREPGTYLVTGAVRLQAPVAEITGIAASQRVSWSHADGAGPPLVRFTSVEQVDAPGGAPTIRVVGGRLESLSVVPLHFE
jgi:hypothetical protein